MFGLREFDTLHIACGNILFHAITVAHLVAQVKFQADPRSVNYCDCNDAGVAKWQTHRT